MNSEKIISIKTINDLEKIYGLMHELRTNLSLDQFQELFFQAQNQNSYMLDALIENEIPVALIGYRILTDFVHGRHLYIDDLVTKESHRSRGIGAKLLSYAETKAKEFDCKNLRLCTGIANELGKKFYEKENWQFKAIVYKKKLMT